MDIGPPGILSTTMTKDISRMSGGEYPCTITSGPNLFSRVRTHGALSQHSLSCHIPESKNVFRLDTI
jgi:hypothetical protein